SIEVEEQLILDATGKAGAVPLSQVSVPECRGYLGKACCNLAETLFEHKDLAEARRRLEHGLRLHRPALAEDPANPEQAQITRTLVQNLVVTLLGQGDHESAARTAEDLVRTFPGSAQDAYRAAGYLARSISPAQEDGKLSTDRRKELAQS